ncbi:MAG: hypothetical protein NVSMB7_13710 [Chitinophagaceae bacterium]
MGIMGGPQTANITEKNDIPNWNSTTGKYYSGKSGIHIGITAEIPFGGNSRFYFEPAILYSEKGRNFTKVFETNTADSFYSFNTTQSLTVQYIDIPLNIAYKLPLSRKKTTHFILSAGPYVSMFYNGKKTIHQNDLFSSSTQTHNTVVNKTEELEVGKKDNSYRTFGYGVNARAGFELGNVTLTGFYSQGLDNLYYAAYQGIFKHKVLGASLGIWLGQIKEPVIVKDKDNDGVPDNTDGCPLLPGTAITNGCPDKDGDGIADNKDRCPDTAGTAKYNGCPVPNTDKDGINDEVDNCPGMAGTADNGGCPVVQEEIKKQLSFAAENIFFATNSAELLPTSYPPLNTVTEILKNNPSVMLTVDGYTDNTGTEAANMTMSARRALEVKNYLVKNGINESRIFTHGYGSANPVADNKTAAGRTKNRRVELKLK